MAIKNIIKKVSKSKSNGGNDISKILKSINDTNNKNSLRIIKLIKSNNVGVINRFSPSAIKAIKASIMPSIEARTEAKRNIFGFKKKTNPPTMKFFNNLFQKYFGESGTPKWMKILFLTLSGTFVYFFDEIKTKLLNVMKTFTAKGLFAKIKLALKENKFIVKILEGFRSIKTGIGNWVSRLGTSVKNLFGMSKEGAKKGPTFIDRLKSIKNSVNNFFAKLIAPFKSFFGGKKPEAGGTKKPSKILQVLKKIGDVIKETKAGKFIKVISRFFPFLMPILAIWETIKGITSGWNEVEETNPEASVIEKLGGAFTGGLKAIWKFFVTDVVDFIGGAAKWIVEKALGFLGFDKAAETIKKQEWNFGTKLSEWLGKAWGWIKGIFGFGEKQVVEKVDGSPSTKGKPTLMSFVGEAVDKVWGWIKTLFSFTPLGLILDKFPGLDITGMMKGLLKKVLEPIVNYEGWGSGIIQSIIPAGLKKFINAPPAKKTIAEELTKTHPGKMTKDDFMKDKKQGSGEGLTHIPGGRVRGLLPGVNGIIKPLDLGQLQSDEGFKKGVYKDTEGIKTIGYGFNLERAGAQEALDAAGIKKSLGDLKSGKLQLTKEEADRLMRGEYPHFADAAKRYVGKETWSKLTLDRQKILTNMAYNMGEKGLNQFNDLRTALQKGDYEQAGEEMMSSKWAGQVKGRADRLSARMTNTSGSQLAASATEQGNLQARLNGGAGNTTIINKGGDNNTEQNITTGTSAINSQVSVNKTQVEGASGN
jgi:lysozyme